MEFSELNEYIDNLENKDDSLISVLHKAQELYGCISKQTQLFIAKRLDIPPAKIYGVVTFYSFFTMDKKGINKISVCTGTACFVRGAEAVVTEFENELGIKSGETSMDGMYSIDSLRCVGACGLAPVVMVCEKVYGRVSPDDVKGIIDEQNEKPG